jgi:hypothetical protein
VARVTTEAEALRLAQHECERLDLRWGEPTVKRGWRWWRIHTPGSRRGGNAVVYVSRKDGSTKVRRYAR